MAKDQLVTVSVAAEGDVGDLAALRAAWTVEDHGESVDASFPDDFARWVLEEMPERTFWIARIDGQPIGMVNLLQVDRMPAPGRVRPSWGYLNNMFVIPEHRSTGVGTQLINALLDQARARKLESIVLFPAEEAVVFYERHKFFSGMPFMLWLNSDGPGRSGTRAS